MKRCYALLLCLMLLATPLLAWSQELGETVEGGILNPSRQIQTLYRFPIDAIDPTPQSNPRGAEAPGYRAPEQLVVYTPGFGETTQTNEYGVEATVENGRLLQMGLGNTPIPANGFIVSAHGASGLWMKRILKPGAYIELNREARQLVVNITPDVYVYPVQKALEKAQREDFIDDPVYHQLLNDANRCYQHLQFVADKGEVNAELIDLSKGCQKMADDAYLRSVPIQENQFRGIWVRPREHNSQEVDQAVLALKQSGIRHIFLETYYQGRTLFPSKTMADYGLPSQQQSFQGWDPMQAWVDAAHRNDMKIYAWVQTFFAGNRTVSPEPYGPILTTYPQWSNVQRVALGTANPQSSTVETGHFFLDPANPEARGYLSKLFMEIIDRYAVDGVNLDYIRYPASHPVKNVDFLKTTWGYSDTARKSFIAMITAEREAAEAQRKAEEAQKLEALKQAALKAGKPFVPPKPKPVKPLLVKGKPAPKPEPPKIDPKDLSSKDPLWPRWVAWRKEQVSSFVQQMSEAIHAKNPKLMVSAVVFHPSQPLNQLKCQDWPRWVASGWLDALTPIGLGPDDERLYHDSLAFKELTDNKIPIYVGIFGMYNRSTPVEFTAQIEAAQRAGMPGVVLFERSKLDDLYRETLLKGAFRQ